MELYFDNQIFLKKSQMIVVGKQIEGLIRCLQQMLALHSGYIVLCYFDSRSTKLNFIEVTW